MGLHACLDLAQCGVRRKPVARVVGNGLRLPKEVRRMRKVPNLSISPEKAFFIVAKARQSGAPQ
jgi:hypothetical protein